MSTGQQLRHPVALCLLVLLLGAAAPAWAASSGRSLEIASGTMEDPVYVRELAEGHYLDGDLEAAVDLYLRVAKLAVEPHERSEALLNASWLQFLLGEESPALAAMHAALRFDPEMEFDARLFSPEFERLYLKARVLRAREGSARTASLPRTGGSAPTGAEVIYKQGVAKLEQGDEEAALELLQRAASLAYGQGAEQLELRRNALLRLGLLYYDRAQWGDAATAFEEAVGLNRSDAAAWKNLGLARSHQGELAAAVAAFQEAYAREPGSLDNARNLAQAVIDTKRWDDAASWIDDAVRHHERDAYLRLLLAQAHAGRGAHQRAAEAWRAAMDLDQSLDWAHGRQAALQLALARLEAKSFAEVATICHDALEHDPADAAFWNLLGLSQQASGDVAEARDSFLKACDHDDSRAEYRNNLGRAYAAVGNLPQAEQEFVHALTLEPDLPAAQANLAQVRKLLREK